MSDKPNEAWGPPRSKTVSWYDPSIVAAEARRLQGREFAQSVIDGSLPHSPSACLLGFRIVEAGEGEVRFLFVPDESTYNPIGMVHGGVLCTVLDTAAGCAVHTLLPVGVGYSSIEIKVSFLKSVRADDRAIEVIGRALRVGRRVAFAEAAAHDGDGELVAHATASFAILEG